MATGDLLVSLLVGYLISSIPFTYGLVRFIKGIDIRKHGSGNVGAANVFRTVGRGAGIAVGAMDIFKGWLALAVVCAWHPDIPAWAKIASGVAAIAGHNWPVWLKFHGGKGVLVSSGLFVYLAWLPMLISYVTFAIVFGLTKYVSLGSLVSTAVVVISLFTIPGPWQEPYVQSLGVIALVLIVFRHRSNIARLLAGSERSFKSGTSKRRKKSG